MKTLNEIKNLALKTPSLKAPTNLCVGETVIYTNDYGAQFKKKILGFCEPQSWGGSVYLDGDSYWFPVPVKNLCSEIC